MSRVRRAAVVVSVVVAVAVAASLAGAGIASAHPLGNFSVNRHSGLVVSPGELRIDHVLDLAEIPTAQARPQIDSDGDGDFAPAELASWAAGRCPGAARGMEVSVDGRRVAVAVRSSSARSAVGQAGLLTLRVECVLVAQSERIAGRADGVTVDFADRAAEDQIGWREVTARGDGATLLDTNVPATSRSARLASYPQDLLTSPPDMRGARLLVRSGGPRLADGPVTPADTAPRLADRLTERVGSLVGGELTLVTLVVALLLAVVVGAAHAVAPGHGKTMVAFYLASRQDGRVRSALIVGATVTATHTMGVLVLGLLVTAGAAFAPERAYPWLTVVSGLLVVGVGVTLVRQAAPRRETSFAARPAVPAHTHGHTHDHGQHGHTHDHGQHGHTHDHGHGHPHWHDGGQAGGHSHSHPREAGPGRAGLVAMGLAGGLLPSPSALVVLLATVGVGKPWLGVLLVLAFGAGMAGTLAAAALLVSRVRDSVVHADAIDAMFGGRLARLARALPLLLAGTVVVLGLVLLVRGLAAVSV